MRIHGVHFLVVAAVALLACGTDADTSATDPNATDPVQGTLPVVRPVPSSRPHSSPPTTPSPRKYWRFDPVCDDVAGGGGCG